MISKKEYENLILIKKKYDSGNAININKNENIGCFKNLNSNINDFLDGGFQYPVWEVLKAERIAKYLTNDLPGEIINVNNEGLKEIEEYKRTRNKSLLSWLAFATSLIIIIISVLALIFGN